MEFNTEMQMATGVKRQAGEGGQVIPVGQTAEGGGQVGQGGSVGPTGGASASSGVNNQAMMGGLPNTIGTGDHVQPLMLGVLQGMRELCNKMQDVEDMLYESWEGPVDWPYVTKALSIKKDYGLACQRANGSKVGAIKNHLLMGVFLACLEDGQVNLEVRKELDAILGSRYRLYNSSFSKMSFAVDARRAISAAIFWSSSLASGQRSGCVFMAIMP